MTATVLCRFAGSDACEEEGEDDDIKPVDIKPVEIDYSESDEPVEHMISPHEGGAFKLEVPNTYFLFQSNLRLLRALRGKCIPESCPH